LAEQIVFHKLFATHQNVLHDSILNFDNCIANQDTTETVTHYETLGCCRGDGGCVDYRPLVCDSCV